MTKIDLTVTPIGPRIVSVEANISISDPLTFPYFHFVPTICKFLFVNQLFVIPIF